MTINGSFIILKVYKIFSWYIEDMLILLVMSTLIILKILIVEDIYHKLYTFLVCHIVIYYCIFYHKSRKIFSNLSIQIAIWLRGLFSELNFDQDMTLCMIV